MDKAYKFRIYPTLNQEQQIIKTFGCCRFVFNHFLHERISAYNNGIPLNYNSCSSSMTMLKAGLPWLREPDATALQSSLKDLDQAYQNFYRRVKNGEKPGFPKFKSKRNNRKSYKSKCVNGNIKVADKHIKLPKLGLVKAAVSKQVEGRVLNATISQSPSGKYYASICCTEVPIIKVKPTGAVVGIDFGIKALAVTSDNVEFENNQYLKNSAEKLARAQRSLSRKAKGSRNRDKARIKVARIQERIADQRLDSIHKMTTQMIRGYGIICIEDLNIAGMVRNRKLAKHISDASWGEITRQLHYKALWQGNMIVEVGRFYPSSQLCSCGYKNTDVKDLNVRVWICPACKATNDRDANAAQNILNEGLRLLAS